MPECRKCKAMQSQLEAQIAENDELRSRYYPTMSTVMPCPNCGLHGRPRFFRDGWCLECLRAFRLCVMDVRRLLNKPSILKKMREIRK